MAGIIRRTPTRMTEMVEIEENGFGRRPITMACFLLLQVQWLAAVNGVAHSDSNV